MRVAIVKYNAGNIRSVKNALDRIGLDSIVSEDPEILKSADKVIFPGVGEASSAMRYLRRRKLDQVIRSLTQPVLGICFGMHLLCRHSEENDTKCLGLVPYKVKKIESNKLKIPHMGWNQIGNLKGSLFENIDCGSYVYFVHSFFVENGGNTIATCNYGVNFSAAIQYKNFYAVQFHTEKSGKIGENILKNFIKL